jgi:hypothetical protein
MSTTRFVALDVAKMCHVWGAIVTFNGTTPPSSVHSIFPEKLYRYLRKNLLPLHRDKDIKLILACYVGNASLIDYYLECGYTIGKLEFEATILGGHAILWQQMISDGLIRPDFDTLLRLFFPVGSIYPYYHEVPPYILRVLLGHMVPYVPAESFNYMFCHTCIHQSHVSTELFSHMVTFMRINSSHVDYALNQGALRILEQLILIPGVKCSPQAILQENIAKELLSDPLKVTRDELIVLLRCGYIPLCNPDLLRHLFLQLVTKRDTNMVNLILSNEACRQVIYASISAEFSSIKSEHLLVAVLEALYSKCDL